MQHLLIIIGLVALCAWIILLTCMMMEEPEEDDE